MWAKTWLWINVIYCYLYFCWALVSCKNMDHYLQFSDGQCLTISKRRDRGYIIDGVYTSNAKPTDNSIKIVNKNSFLLVYDPGLKQKHAVADNWELNMDINSKDSLFYVYDNRDSFVFYYFDGKRLQMKYDDSNKLEYLLYDFFEDVLFVSSTVVER